MSELETDAPAGTDSRGPWTMVAARHRRIPVGATRMVFAAALGILAMLFRFHRFVFGSKGKTSPKQVLILEPFGMGDVISLGPLVRMLSEQGFVVHAATRPEWHDLLCSIHVTSKIAVKVPWTDYSVRQKYRCSLWMGDSFRCAIRQLKRVAPSSIGLDVRGDIRSVLLLYMAGCDRVVTLSRYLGTNVGMFPWAATRTFAPDNLPRWRLNTLHATSLGAPIAASEPPDLTHLRNSGARSSTGGAKHVGLVPMTPWSGKRWPAGHWQTLINQLTAPEILLTGLCGPGEHDGACRALGERISIEQCTSIQQWVTALERMDIILTVNTGPMHLAAALGKPVVALCGSCSLPLWAPPGARSVVIQHQNDFPCAPCHQTGERCARGFACMRSIRPDEVVEAAIGLLLNPSPGL